MKKLIILLLFPFLTMAQKTYVPDNEFEQALINLLLDGVLDDSVTTSAIDTLTELYLSNNNISSLIGIEDFVQLRHLFCSDNQIVTLDLRENINLFEFNCRNNLLTSLDVRNGNNLGLQLFTALYNPDLYCIAVDDVSNADANWEKDNGCTFSVNCNTSSIEEINKNKSLVKVVDLLGREIPASEIAKHIPLLYIYDDGTVEKRIVIE